MLKGTSFRPSALWQGLQKGIFAQTQTLNLDDFRNPGTLNNRLSSWDPVAHNQRYYKTILFNTASSLPERFFELYRCLDTSVGQPVTIKMRGLPIDLDYLQAVEELLFMEPHLKGVASVCEIGAGFGRTAHALLMTQPHIESYAIIDLPECLVLSQRYLERVLDPRTYKKLRFLATDQNLDLPGSIDLFMNINSMAEMDQEVIKNYFSLIDRLGSKFYTKNTVAKYRPESLGISKYNEADLKAAMSSGLLTQVIDIFDDQALADARARYDELMSPGGAWSLVRSSPALPWAYYQHAIYQRKQTP